jgi:hypothetical protein
VLQDVSEFGLRVDVRHCNFSVEAAEQIELLENRSFCRGSEY